MIIKRYNELRQVYHALGPGDFFVGQIPGNHLQNAILADLTSRGVGLLPPAIAQIVSSSKTSQAFVLSQWMVPQTKVITRRKTLLDALAEYSSSGVTTAITKQERMHCGHGVRLWSDLELMYSCLSLNNEHYPFVLQPYVEVITDLRIIIVGDFNEAYARHNSSGFRKNLAAGGNSVPFVLGQDQLELCRQIMDRVQMPFAHIDLLITRDGGTFLSEISLNGGIHGACISRPDLDDLKHRHLMVLTGGA